jgi:CubicO group peptidase (beta-lactamase class C family)
MSGMTRRGVQVGGLASLFAATAARGEGRPSPAALQDIGVPARTAVETGALPGVVTLVWRKGQVVQADAQGVLNLEAKTPMARDSIFRLASMSKPVTVATALTLVDQGRMRLDDPITRWAPEFAHMRVLKRADGPLDDTYPAPRAITIEDLMTHRSGITSYPFLAPGPLGVEVGRRIGFGIGSPLTPDQWLAAMAALPLAYAPGERFNYGFSIDVLGFIVGRAGGSTLRQVMLERVCGPLGMTDTDFWIPPAKRPRAAEVYLTAAPKIFVPQPIEGFVGEKPPAYTSGGQGLVTKVDDYLTFARMLLGGGRVNGVRLLKPETVRLMTSDHLTPQQRAIPTVVADWKTQGFGLGMSLITDAAAYAASGRGVGAAGSFGWPGAFGGWWQADPVNQVILIWLQQVLPSPPQPGKPITLPPGTREVIEFQKRAYAALGL